MKKLLTFAVIFATLAYMSIPALAAKPNPQLAGAKTYAWHLSGDVMPVPPYGLSDIVGSDTASKLIVNQPNGKVYLNLTGVMSGLDPNTLYTVYLSNPYQPYVFTGWNVESFTGFDFEYLGGHYVHSADLTQTGSSVDGTGGFPFGGPFSYEWDITSGSVIGNHVHLDIDYTSGAICSMTMDGDINPGGDVTNGTWSDNCAGPRNGTWTSVGVATDHTGDTTWPGQLTGTTPFTFMTDDLGEGSWHYNFKVGNVTQLSVWINGAGGTLLVSDSISL